MRIPPQISSTSIYRSATAKRKNLLRLLALLCVVSVVAAVVGSSSSAAGSLGQLLNRASIIFSGNKTRTASVKAARVSAALNSAAPEPQSPSATMTTERRLHTATRLADGRVLIAGGENTNGVLNQTEIYDPAGNTFSVAANMGAARADHSATLLSDGRVLLAGGRNASGALATTEFFDPTTGTFTSGPALSVARTGHSATLFADGRILFAGGDGGGSAEILDLTLSNSSAAGSLNTARSTHSAALLQDGRVLIVGGRDAGGNELSSGEIFDGSSFTAVSGALTVARVHALLRVLFDGKVQVIGGSNDGSMEIYDPQIQTFGAYAHVLPESDTCVGLPAQVQASQTRAALFHNGQADAVFDRTSHSITELAGQAIAVGGVNSGGAVLGSTPLFTSSAAAISTDKLDYAPGETAYIHGRGFQAGETVRLKIHEDPHTPQERGLDVVADADGNFSGEYLVQDYDLAMKFIVGARGLSSGRSAQTTFTDNKGLTVTKAGTGTGTVTGTGNITSGTFINCGADCFESVNNNEIVTLTQSANAGSIFTGWNVAGGATSLSGGCTTAGPTCSFNMNNLAITVTATFTPNDSVDSVAVGSQSGAVTYGTGGSVTFPITVNRGITTGAFSANLTIGALPVGATALFSPNPVAFAAGDNSKTSTLTITTANTTPAVTATSFTVTATNTTLASDNASGNGSLTVSKAHLSVTADNKSRLYGDSNPTFTATLAGFKNGETLATSGVTGSPTFSGTGPSSIGTTSSGPYTITPAQGTLAANNYDFTPFNNGTLTIDKAHLSVTADDKNRFYGDANPTFTATLAGFKNGETLATSGVTGSPTFSGTGPSSIGTTAPGPYTITPAQGTLAANNYDFTPFNNGTLTIDKAHLSVTADDKNRFYGDANPTFTATLTGFRNGETLATSGVTGSPTFSGTGPSSIGTTAPGPYTITPAQGTLAANNYDFTPFNNGTLTINKATLTVTADNTSRDYGDANPTFTASYSGFKNGEVLATSGVTGSPSLTTTATATSAVAGSPYTITATLGTLAAGNYQFTFVNGQLTITPRALDVTAKNQSKSYGDTFTFTGTEFISGTGQLVNSDSVTSVTLTSTGAVATATVAGSSYSIVPSAAVGSGLVNYAINYHNGALTVDKRLATWTTNANSKTYGDMDPAPLTTGSGSNFVAGDSVTATYSRVAGENASPPTYHISATLSATPLTALDNYIITNAGAEFTINKRLATWNTNANSKTYGDIDPAPLTTGSGSNFVAGDSVTATYSRVAGEDGSPPTYHISATLSATPLTALDNYIITNAGAEFTINKRLATWTTNANSKTYGDMDPAPLTTGSGSNFVAGDSVTATYSRVAGENASPPTYHISATLSATPLTALDNYIITNAGAEFTINKRLATWTTNANSKTYGDMDPPPLTTGSGSNFVSGDSVTATYSRVAGENASPPTYHISATLSATPLTALDNYIITNGGAEFTINKRLATWTTNANSKTYGDMDPAPLTTG